MLPKKPLRRSIYLAKVQRFLVVFAVQTILLVVMCSIAFSVAELIARARTDRPLHADDITPSALELLSSIPQTEKQQFLTDRAGRKEHKIKYYDYHLYSAKPYESSTLTITDFFSARNVPDSSPITEAEMVVWMLGGSTMEQYGSPDKRTIANQVAIRLKQEGIRASIYNFGIGAFQSSMELIKFQNLLRQIPRDMWPTHAVFYDGLNDVNYGLRFGAGKINSNLSDKLRILVEKEYLKVAWYALSAWLTEHSVIFRDYFFTRAKRLIFAGWNTDSSDENLRKTVEAYLLNTRFIQATCVEMSIKCSFVLQPLVTSKNGLTEFEKVHFDALKPENVLFIQRFYEAVIQSRRLKKDFIDLSAFLDHDGESDFVDLGHTGPLTGQKIGYALAEALISTNETPKP